MISSKETRIIIINKENTDLLKWISSISVLIGHILLYSNNIGISEMAFMPPFGYFIGTICVGIFLFLSGYGLSYSLLSKHNYLQCFGGRIKSILLPFLIIVILYQIVSYIINFMGLSSSMSDVSMSILDKILPFCWYVFLQFVLYLIFYVSFKYITKKYYYGLIVFSLLCITLMLLMRYLKFPSYSIISIPSFLLGTYCGFLRSKNYFIITLFRLMLIIVLIINIIFRIDIPLINYTLISFCVVCFFCIIPKIPTIICKVIKAGDGYFIYLIQGLWIILPKYENLYTYILCSFGGSIISAFVLSWIYKNTFLHKKQL